MVAEPVHATIETLSYLYGKASDFISTNHDNIVNSELFDQLSQLVNISQHDINIHISPSVRKPPPTRFVSGISENVKHHKLQYLTIFTIGLGTASYVWYEKVYKPALLHQSKKDSSNQRYKRRVPKLSNGARADVVLVIGSPTEPLTRLIALDFEKRGFIVYLTILDDKDFKYAESNPITDDINYLNLNESASFESQLIKFNHLLELPVIPFPGAEAHNLKLKAIVFAPSLYFPIGPIENITVSTWSRLQDKIFIYLKLFSSGLIQLSRDQASKIIFIYPSIISSLSIPYHSPETLFQNQLRNLFTTLTREVHQHGLSVTQVRLGNLQISSQRNNTSNDRISTLVNSEIKAWDDDIKDLYAKSFSQSQFKSNPIKSTGGKGTSLRELYHTLFDLIYSTKRRNPAIVYCGTGARSYDIISRIFPESWIEWLLR
ncbi:uncharacterized protein RJT21DRAFT_83597 [Scheffersomyces amazonensis]|uniref:uncharacterized protein n=1 Tax=Scheffersomyces amazonensis TaxID=1078765 RepID=UPI00315DEE8E